jgi:hypothetical protein
MSPAGDMGKSTGFRGFLTSHENFLRFPCGCPAPGKAN